MRSGVMSGFNVKANSIVTPCRSSLFHEIPVRLGTAVAEELPGVAYFLNLVKVQIRDDNLLLVPRSFRDDLSPRRTEITLTVKLSDIPGLLAADAIDGAEKISIRYRMRRLLELPQVLA